MNVNFITDTEGYTCQNNLDGGGRRDDKTRDTWVDSVFLNSVTPLATLIVKSIPPYGTFPNLCGNSAKGIASESPQ